ncbi:MAG: efflux RND transporter periplasmic adaptor subunit [Thiomargarita sp.]|nr:efflux RND transporter periplasmic adaptor subunit [Thiomargarita sp.]
MLKNSIRIIVVLVFLSSASVTVKAEDYYEVRAYNISPPVTLSGTVIAEKEVTLSAQLPGRVEMIAGEEGNAFKQGATLITLNDRALLAKRYSAIAAWQRANAILRNAGMQYSRELRSPDSPSQAPGGMGLPHLLDQILTKPMSNWMGKSDEGLDRRAQLHSYGSKIEQARSGLMQAKSQIEQIDASLRDAKSIAPFDGVIIKKWIEVGDTVQPGQQLLQFADIQQLQIEVQVPARLIRGLKVDKQFSAQLDVLDESIIVTVAQIFPIADPQRHTVKVKFDLTIDHNSEQGQYVGPGQYAQVEIPDIKAGQHKILLIPKTAIIRHGSLPSVCVITGNDSYERRIIRLGSTINTTLMKNINHQFGEFISVLSGLKEGDQLVIINTRRTPC